MPGEFLDTNVLLYLFAGNSKAARARELLLRRPRISVQVLNEAANAARRKLHMTWPEINLFLLGVRDQAEVDPVTLSVHGTGLHLAERYRLATYDAMIVAAALEAGCTTLWSEDMQHGFSVKDRLTILNPFLAQGATT